MSLHDNGYGYLSVGLVINGKLKTICIHKLVSIHFLGHKPDGYNIVIDHIDNDKLNNRADNLQLISHRENCTKDRRNNSKYTGVHKPKGRKKWTSSIHCNGKRHFLGCFDTELDASNAYQAELKKL
jgi:hypothetical protein